MRANYAGEAAGAPLSVVFEQTLTATIAREAGTYLLLFEGRRIRGGSSEILLSPGFIEFENLLRVLIHAGNATGRSAPT
ncbi:MAG: hypothetical protein M3P29_00340 [Acidobacteriota bacterium]|nr:hypothetical protein [Acidobacteriota bacterium]